MIYTVSRQNIVSQPSDRLALSRQAGISLEFSVEIIQIRPSRPRWIFCQNKTCFLLPQNSLVFHGFPLFFFQCLGNFWGWRTQLFHTGIKSHSLGFLHLFFHAFPSLVILRSFEVIFLGVGWGYQKSTTGTLFIICISLLHIFHNLDAFKRSLI